MMPPGPHAALDLFGAGLTSDDDAAALEALQEISAALLRDGLTIDRVLRHGLKVLGSPGPTQAPTHYTDAGDAARALLSSGCDLGRKAGQFCGGLVFQSERLTDAQDRWLRGLLRRAGLPPLLTGEP